MPSTLKANAIVTLDDAKIYANLDVTKHEDDVLIETLINCVSSAFDDEAGRQIISSVHTAESLDGPGGELLYLPARPVTLLSSITESGVALVSGTNFTPYLDRGILAKISSTWTTLRNAIVITYTAGYTNTGSTPTLPDRVRRACLVEIARDFQRHRKSGWGETSRTIEGASITSDPNLFLPDTLQVLRRMKRILI